MLHLGKAFHTNLLLKTLLQNVPWNLYKEML